ncbi:hypothetical protein [Lentzea guizhouensis]|uniref:hypothetical protein n=1 Tax=Lentzea guizhouensis TaxID=1586287 RepID=UPI001473A458|nr:hypothetical protein [Lentzea guizhouensis]
MTSRTVADSMLMKILAPVDAPRLAALGLRAGAGRGLGFGGTRVGSRPWPGGADRAVGHRAGRGPDELARRGPGERTRHGSRPGAARRVGVVRAAAGLRGGGRRAVAHPARSCGAVARSASAVPPGSPGGAAPHRAAGPADDGAAPLTDAGWRWVAEETRSALLAAAAGCPHPLLSGTCGYPK